MATLEGKERRDKMEEVSKRSGSNDWGSGVMGKSFQIPAKFALLCHKYTVKKTQFNLCSDTH